MFIAGRAVAGLELRVCFKVLQASSSQVVPLEKAAFVHGHRDQRIRHRRDRRSGSWWCFHPAHNLEVVLLDVSCFAATCGFWKLKLVSPLSNLPIGAVVLLGLTVLLRLRGIANKNRALPSRAKISNMDPLGCFVFMGAVCCLLLALQWGWPDQSRGIRQMLLAAWSAPRSSPASLRTSSGGGKTEP